MAVLLDRDYTVCRDRFRAAADAAGVDVTAHAISASAPAGPDLTIDVARLGPVDPRAALVVLSGVHGVEAPIGSALQADLLDRVAGLDLPADLALVLVHTVNPWGLANGRRQNEHNVDLNRNWRRSARTPDPNEPYLELHPHACPDTPDLPALDALFAAAAPFIARHGIDWVADGITRGQYAHPDGLHFGGDRTEDSCRILEETIPPLLGGTVERSLVVDLHTGVGPMGDVTFLSSHPTDSPADRFLRAAFGPVKVNDDPKPGQIAAGLAVAIEAPASVAITVEFGTASDEEQLAATYHEQWVHRSGRGADPAFAAVRDRYFDCFTPPDPAWAAQALTDGRDLIDRAWRAVAIVPA